MPAASIIFWLIVGLLAAGFIGWIGSLVGRLETNAAIYLAIGAGAVGGLLGPATVGFNSALDCVLASMLTAALLTTLFVVVDKKLGGHSAKQP